MSDLFTDFQKVNKQDWADKIYADLKDKDPGVLENSDLIEEISFSSFYHREDTLNTDNRPGNFPFSRGMNKPNNGWKNGALIAFSNELEANKKALKALNSGADLLVIKPLNDPTDWEVILAGIQFEHIETQFVINSKRNLEKLLSFLPENLTNIHFNIDFLEDNWSDEDFIKITTHFKKSQHRFCSVNGFKLQNSGATTWQEIAFSLSTSHEYLINLMAQGFSIDEASACIGFKIGIGGNYFYEIAKIRTLKHLWAKIIKAYSPAHNCSYNCHITAVLGHMNKSLDDPYTNLLRQTTEAMAAVCAGIDSLVVLPYDLLSKEGSSVHSERLALNISSILNEEAYLAAVIDPLGGSYSLEKLTELIGRKTWTEFQQLDKKGCLFNQNTHKDFLLEVHSKRELRIRSFLNGDTIGVGINKYSEDQSKRKEWISSKNYLGFKPLFLENEYKMAKV